MSRRSAILISRDEFKTDADGKVTLSLNGAGRHIVSAKVEGKTLVAPVFAAFVFKKADVYVTIADQNGNTPVAAKKITVSDIDMDSALTINDALYCAHEEYYDGGARAGYATKKTEYGLSLDKLWGSANGGSYGYYVNNASAWSLTDPVNEGDYLAAFCYTDLKGWSDHYSYFDKFNTTADTGEEFTVTYNEAAYDKDWNPITLPVEGAHQPVQRLVVVELHAGIVRHIPVPEHDGHARREDACRTGAGREDQIEREG